MNRLLRTLSPPLVLGLALAGCELHDANEGEEPDALATDMPGTDPDAAVLEPVPEGEPPVSIIRDDAREDELEFPPEPFEVTIPFGDSGNDLTESAERLLSTVLDAPALEEGWPVILRGHTDSSGNDSANLRASRARAEAVAAWLVERGVDDDRIIVIPFGEQNPIAPNANPDGTSNERGRARNRRVEIEIAPTANTDAETPDAEQQRADDA